MKKLKAPIGVQKIGPVKDNNGKKILIWEKFNNARTAMNQAIVEHSEEIDLILTSLLCKEHTLLVGPPGTAKSLIAKTLANWIVGGKAFTVHCCKDTTRESAFGPLKITKLREDIYDRVLDIGAAGCHVLVLEEVFKAGPSVLDMFLMLLNERMYVEGVVCCKSPLQTAILGSNEWTPEGHESSLNAFFDRPLFRKEIHYVSQDIGRRELLRKAENNDSCEAQFQYPITLSELDQAYKESSVLKLTAESKRCLWQITEELTKEGVSFSDRRLMKVCKAVRAYAYLNGADEVQPEHLEVLAHVLWDDPGEQRQKCERVVNKLANPIRDEINRLWVQARSSVNDVDNLGERITQLQDVQHKLKILADNPQKPKVIAYVEEALKQALYKQNNLKV